MTLVAFDAKEFNRGLGKTFFACLGAGVEIKNETDFKEKYDECIEELSKKFNFTRERKVYSAYDLGQKLGFAKSIAFWENFIKSLGDFIVNLNVYYTILPPSKVPKVKLYGAQKSRVVEIDTLSFLRRLNPAYVHCCAWKYLLETQSLPEHFLLDYFEYEVSNAWSNLISKMPPKIYYHGDECNPFIATADIFALLVDVRLYRKKLGLCNDGITKAFTDVNIKATPSPIDVRHLSNIVPYRNQKIDTTPYIARPVIFIIPETTELMRPRAVREMIKASPFMNEILNKAFDINASVKFYDPDIDSKVVRSGDIVIYTGPKSKEVAELLNRLHRHTLRLVDEKDIEVI